MKFNGKIQGRIHTLSRGNNTYPPIIVQFLDEESKSQILKQTKLLKGTTYYVNQDFSFETRNIRRKLTHYMWEARNEGHKAVLNYNKLYVNDEVFHAENFPDIPNTHNNYGTNELENQVHSETDAHEPDNEDNTSEFQSDTRQESINECIEVTQPAKKVQKRKQQTITKKDSGAKQNASSAPTQVQM